MFRQTKRKPKNLVNRRLSSDQKDKHDDSINTNEHQQAAAAAAAAAAAIEQKDNDDNEEEEESPVVIRKYKEKKRKESKRGVYGNDDTSKKQKTKQKRGLGLGGMTMVIDEDESDFGIIGEESQEYAAPAYGKEALDALRAEQRTTKLQGIVQEASIESEFSEKIPEDVPRRKSKEQDFISLHENAEATEQDFVEEEIPSQPILLEDPDDDDWEAQVARRAGIPSSTAAKSSIRQAVVVTPTLHMLRGNLQDTIQHLATREEDLGNVIMRRQADLAQTQADRKRQQESIQQAGKACGDYQKLRYELAMWVGALRDLEEKVGPIQKAMLDMVSLQFETAHQEWIYWQDDVCATLRDCHQLDRVLGRTPPELTAQEVEVQLDEFGRDVGSQIRRDRENRSRRRREKGERIQGDLDSKDPILEYLWAKEEGADRRYDILQEALRVAMDDLDDDYSSPQVLEECFANWKKNNSDEYRQCYANLSLADLGHVFDQVGLCRATWVRAILKDSYDLVMEGTLFPTVIVIPQDEGDPESAAYAALERAYRKEYIPFLLELVKEYPSTIFLSKRMSHLFSESLPEIIQKIGQDSGSAKELCSAFASAGLSVLNSLSIPLLKPTAGEEIALSNERLDDSIRFAQAQQPLWINSLILNLLEQWMPFLRRTSLEAYENLGRAILSFLSENYLYFLSSRTNTLSATEHLAPIWKCLSQNYKHLLESPEFMLQSAPIRAAASAYGLATLY